MMTVDCAVVGVAKSMFHVDIDQSLSVGHLKDKIKAKNPAIMKCDARDLQLYLAKKERGDGAWLTEKEVMKGVKNTSGLKPLDVVSGPLKDVRFRVTKEDVKAGKIPVHVLVVVPQRKLVPSSTKKRKLAEMSELITPSSFAKCKGGGGWVKWLKKLDGQTECHRVERSDDKTPIPVVLLNETFARFEENCKQIKFSPNDRDFVSKLCHGLSTPYDSEAAFAEKARELLTGYLLADVPASTITPATVNGLQNGNGGEDPTMQNVAYYIKNFPLVIDRQFPCFLVDICGPFISACGIVNTGDEEAICESLVMSFTLLFFDKDWLMVSLTRMCASLKAVVQELTDAWDELSLQKRASCMCTTALDRLRFPYKDSVECNGADIEVVHRYAFKAQHAGNNVIVKFAKRYGKKAHEYCSRAGFAPELLFCGFCQMVGCLSLWNIFQLSPPSSGR